MKLEIDANFEEKLTCGLKNDIRNQEHTKVSKLELLLGPFKVENTWH